MRSDQISELISNTSVFSVVFPLLAYLIRFKNASRSAHLIGVLSISSGLADLTCVYLHANGQSSAIPMVFNSSFFSFFLLLSLVYYSILKTSKKTVIIGFTIYAVSYLAITAFIQPFHGFQTLMWTIGGMTMILYSISYFMYLFTTEKAISEHGLLWINSGVLFYFSLNLFLFVMSSYVLTQLETELKLLIWSFHNVNNIMRNVLFGVGILALTNQVLTHATHKIKEVA